MSTAVVGAPAFRARSGRTVRVGDDGTVMFDHANGYLSPASAMDAEEFFQAKRDVELGRWRWPENPDWVAIEGPREDYGRTVVVVNERTLERFWLNDHVLDLPEGSDLSRDAGRAFFKAHPERKPWEDAATDEAWELTFSESGGGSTQVWIVHEGTFRNPRFVSRVMLNDSTIVAGRRVWPEEAS